MQLYAPLGNFRANKIQVASEILNLTITNNYVDMKSTPTPNTPSYPFPLFSPQGERLP